VTTGLLASKLRRIEIIVTCDTDEGKEAVATSISESRPEELRV
jgi:hypothetical protein